MVLVDGCRRHVASRRQLDVVVATATTLALNCLRVQLPAQTDVAALIDRLVAEAIPNQHGRAAWQAFIRAHATLMRQLAMDLVDDIGLTLGDFDVLAQLGQAGGELRISELAAQAYSSRSGMTRRIDRLVDEGLVTRANTDTDGRGVVVALTEAGVARLSEAAPVHLFRVRQLFVDRLSDEELATLATALEKVVVDCGFG
jgi:DNA-binding MarR family transcriptional regulator